MSTFPMVVLWQVDFHMGRGIDPVAVSLPDPSSATMFGGKDVTKRQKGLQKERGEQTSRLGSVMIPWVAHNHGWYRCVSAPKPTLLPPNDASRHSNNPCALAALAAVCWVSHGAGAAWSAWLGRRGSS